MALRKLAPFSTSISSPLNVMVKVCLFEFMMADTNHREKGLAQLLIQKRVYLLKCAFASSKATVLLFAIPFFAALGYAFWAASKLAMSLVLFAIKTVFPLSFNVSIGIPKLFSSVAISRTTSPPDTDLSSAYTNTSLIL